MTNKDIHINPVGLYKSKLDISTLIVLISAVFLAGALIGKLPWFAVPYFVFILIYGFPVLLNTYYRIDKNVLFVKSGLFL